MRNKENLCESIKRKIKNDLLKPTKLPKHMERLEKKYNISQNISSDIFGLKAPLDSYEDFVVFAIASEYMSERELSAYFTESEIKKYSGAKQEKESYKFPIKWKMIQVNEDQWIGTISTDELKRLEDAQLLNYNEKTQRTMRYKNGVFSIFINKHALLRIIESLKNKLFIPNTITLNIPAESEFDFNGDELIIYNTECLDILDGYHRYLGLSKMYHEDDDYNFTMELRVVSFSEEKAKQFIYQEDQKTKMKKVDSQSFNQGSYSNQLISMLNQTTLLREMFNHTGIIDPAIAAAVLSYTTFKNTKKIPRSMMLKLKEQYVTYFQELLDSDVTILDKKWDLRLIVSAFYIFSLEEKPDNLYESIIKLNGILCSDEYSYMFRGNNIFSQDINRTARIYREEV